MSHTLSPGNKIHADLKTHKMDDNTIGIYR